jgi:hypothetical protein
MNRQKFILFMRCDDYIIIYIYNNMIYIHIIFFIYDIIDYNTIPICDDVICAPHAPHALRKKKKIQINFFEKNKIK